MGLEREEFVELRHVRLHALKLLHPSIRRRVDTVH
jgi:hypothetical protein